MDRVQIPPSPFPQSLGIKILEASAERVVAVLNLDENHANAVGIAHGGVIFTLADHAFGTAQNLMGELFVAMEMHIRYLRPGIIGQTLTATATPVHRGRETSFFQILVCDEKDRTVAVLSATGHRMAQPKPQDA